MTELYKQFKREKLETVGETDKKFDKSNYIDWLEARLNKKGIFFTLSELAILKEECYQDGFEDGEMNCI